MAMIGKRNTLGIIRESGPGLYLNGGELGEILLPGRYIPRDLKQGDKLDVFIYLDSEDRPALRPIQDSSLFNNSMPGFVKRMRRLL